MAWFYSLRKIGMPQLKEAGRKEGGRPPVPEIPSSLTDLIGRTNTREVQALLKRSAIAYRQNLALLLGSG